LFYLPIAVVLYAASSTGLRAASAFTRRGLLTSAAVAAATTSSPAASSAASEELIDVYFGCGCFWHVQHEFVVAEQRILGRKNEELTALAGYAGGSAGARDGKVCYHNAAQISDYGNLGHAEVVRLQIPPSSFAEFAKEYVALFDKDGNRPDQFGDRGGEYRNVVGVPGGRKNPLVAQLVQSSAANGDKLDFAAGKGNDADARAVAFIMDSTEYPFYQAEVYHQFHDGFNLGENYPNSYNGLAQKLLKLGSVVDQGCPNGMLGIGLAGL